MASGGSDTNITVGVDSSGAKADLSRLEKLFASLNSGVDKLNNTASVLEARLKGIESAGVAGFSAMSNQLTKLDTRAIEANKHLADILSALTSIKNGSGFSAITKDLNNLKTASASATASLNAQNGAARSGGVMAGVMSGKITSLESAMATLGPTGTFAFKGIELAARGAMMVVSALLAPVKLLISLLPAAYNNIEETAQAYQGFIAATNQQFGAGMGQTQWEWLVDTSNALGTNLQDNAKSYHQLAAAMASIDKDGSVTKDIFSGISVAGAVMQKSTHSVGLALQAVQQIMSKGAPSWEELRQQLSEHIPGSTDALVQSLMKSARYIEAGATTAKTAWAKLNDDIKTKSISSIEVLLRLSNELKNRYGAALLTPSQLLVANINILKNKMTEFWVEAGKSGIIESLNSVLRTASGIIMTLTENIGVLTGPFNDMMKMVDQFISSLTVEDVKYFVDTVGTYLSALFEIAKSFFGNMTGESSSAIDALKAYLEVSAMSMAQSADLYRQMADSLSMLGKMVKIVMLGIKSAILSAIYTIMGFYNKIAQDLPDMMVSKDRKNRMNANMADMADSISLVRDEIKANVLGIADILDKDGWALSKKVKKMFDGISKAAGSTKIVSKDLSGNLDSLVKTKTEDDLRKRIAELEALGGQGGVGTKGVGTKGVGTKGKGGPTLVEGSGDLGFKPYDPYTSDFDSTMSNYGNTQAELYTRGYRQAESGAYGDLSNGVNAKNEQLLQDQAVEQAMAQEHQNKLLAIAKDGQDKQRAYEQLSLGMKTRFYASTLTDIITLTGTNSKRLIKISQGAAALDALISTYQGQAASLKLGGVAGLIAAIKVGAAGFGFVSKIKSLSKSASSSISSGIGSTTLPAQAIADTAPAPKQTIEFNFSSNGRTIFREDEVIDMMNQIRDRINDGDNRMGATNIS